MRATICNWRPMPVVGKVPTACPLLDRALVTNASVLMARVDTLLSSLSKSCERVSVIRRRMAKPPAADP